MCQISLKKTTFYFANLEHEGRVLDSLGHSALAGVAACDTTARDRACFFLGYARCEISHEWHTRRGVSRRWPTVPRDSTVFEVRFGTCQAEHCGAFPHAADVWDDGKGSATRCLRVYRRAPRVARCLTRQREKFADSKVGVPPPNIVSPGRGPVQHCDAATTDRRRERERERERDLAFLSDSI